MSTPNAAPPATISIDFRAEAQAEEDQPTQQGPRDLELVEGNAVKLSWTVRADEGYDLAVEIASRPDGLGPGASSASGTHDVSPSAPVAFTLTAKATKEGVDAGEKSAVVTLHTHPRGEAVSPITEVRAARRPRVTLTAATEFGVESPDGALHVEPNSVVTLRWKIEGEPDQIVLDPNPLGAGLSDQGEQDVTVAQSDRTFTLRASNSAGEDAQALTVLVG